MGTATYFSPEQAQGAQPDPRSDLYSLGIVMYEMIAGRPPFGGDNPVSIAYKQVHDYPTPLNQVVLDIPRPYEAIIAKLLTKDPAVRYSVGRRAARRPPPLPQRRAPGGVGVGRGDGARDRRGDHRRGQPVAAAHRGAAQGRRRTGSADRDRADRVRAPLAGRRSSCRRAYRDDRSSRTGWYALAAFFALISLGIGGFLLFNALSNNDDPGNARALDDYRRPGAVGGDRQPQPSPASVLAAGGGPGQRLRTEHRHAHRSGGRGDPR